MQVRQVADGPLPSGHAQFGAVDPVVRPLKEALEHPELVEDLHRRRMDRVAAEIAEEVLVLLEDADVAARPGEQQAGHHARGSAADDDQVRIAIRRHGVRPLQPMQPLGNVAQ